MLKPKPVVTSSPSPANAEDTSEHMDSTAWDTMPSVVTIADVMSESAYSADSTPRIRESESNVARSKARASSTLVATSTRASRSS